MNFIVKKSGAIEIYFIVMCGDALTHFYALSFMFIVIIFFYRSCQKTRITPGEGVLRRGPARGFPHQRSGVLCGGCHRSGAEGSGVPLHR